MVIMAKLSSTLILYPSAVLICHW